jgi:hypothetical protein
VERQSRAGTDEAFTVTAFRHLPYCGVTNVGNSITLLAGLDYPYDIPAGWRTFDDYLAFDPPPLLDEEDPEPDPEEDEEIEDRDSAGRSRSRSGPRPIRTIPIRAWSRSSSRSGIWTTPRSRCLATSCSRPASASCGTGRPARCAASIRSTAGNIGRSSITTSIRTTAVGCVGVGTLDADIELPPGEDEYGAGYRIDGKVRHDEADEQTYPTWAIGLLAGRPHRRCVRLDHPRIWFLEEWRLAGIAGHGLNRHGDHLDCQSGGGHPDCARAFGRRADLLHHHQHPAVVDHREHPVLRAQSSTPTPSTSR